jgi:hypothetical protein
LLSSEETEVEKTHERQTVADHQHRLLVGQIVRALQHQNLELQDRVIGLAASIAHALLWRRSWRDANTVGGVAFVGDRGRRSGPAIGAFWQPEKLV